VNRATRAAISVIEFPYPSPFSVTRARAFDASKMAAEGVNVVYTEKVHLSGYDGLLYRVRQVANGEPVERWKLGMGDEQRSVIIEATYSQSDPQALSDLLRTILLSVRWVLPEPSSWFKGLHFQITESAALKIVEREPEGLLLRAADALIPAPGPTLLVAEQSGLPDIPPDLNYKVVDIEAARQMLESEFTDIRNVGGEAIMQGELHAQEVTADARRKDDRVAVRVYALMIVDPNHHRAYFAYGAAGLASARRFMPEFQAVARSLKPTP
jgi:hypothetical protein